MARIDNIVGLGNNNILIKSLNPSIPEETNLDGINNIINTNNGLSDLFASIGQNNVPIDNPIRTGVFGPEVKGVSSIGDYMYKSGDIESNNSYTSLNPRSGAYGRWQILPKYQKYYADKAGLSVADSKTPSGQDKVAEIIYNDGTKFLDKHNYDKSDRNRYLVHQQGRQGKYRHRLPVTRPLLPPRRRDQGLQH